MHSQDGPQLDLSAQVARVREKTRPWKSIIALVLAIMAASFSVWARDDRSVFKEFMHAAVPGVAAIAFCVFGSMATYGLSRQVRNALEDRVGASHAAVVGYTLLLAGAFTTLVITLDLFGVSVGQLVLGGALTSVFVGIAAQQALSNVFAGMVLLLARPFRVGDNIRLRAGALGGQMDGIVTDIGITYVRLNTGGSVMAVPNSQVLNAVVGPVPAPPSPPPADPSPPDPAPSDDAATPSGARSGSGPRPGGGTGPSA
jgi:small-conductance mechanosensitive channel